MEEPSIDGLKLALVDGDGSVKDNTHDDPNRPPEYFIEKLEISEAKHIGRSKPLKCRFNQSLNAIIGGRGSGKSTFWSSCALPYERDGDIPEPLKQESRQYFNVGGDSLLIEKSKISLTYLRHGVRYRLNWSAEADCLSLEEEKDGDWILAQGKSSRFFQYVSIAKSRSLNSLRIHAH